MHDLISLNSDLEELYVPELRGLAAFLPSYTRMPLTNRATRKTATTYIFPPIFEKAEFCTD